MTAALAALAALIALPFLFPFAAGPSANVWQQLAAWTCAALLLGMAPVARPGRAIVLWLLMCGVLIVLAHGGQTALVLSAATAVVVVALASAVGSGLAQALRPVARVLAVALLGAGLASAVLGVLQYYGLSEALAPWTTSPGLGQAYGNLRQRNQFATLISIAMIALLGLYAARRPRGRVGWVAAGIVLVVAAAASTSRTGLLQLLLISGVSSFLAWRERRAGGGAANHRLPSPWLLLALIPAYLGASWLLPLLADGGVESMVRRLREGAPIGHSRLVLWSNVLHLIGERPWTGWGWGELSHAHYATLYGGPRFVEILDNAHNLPLHLAVELGIPAAVLICGGFAWMVLRARPWRETDPARIMAWGVLGTIVLHSLLEYPLWYGPFQLVFGLCLGFLWPGRAKDVDEQPRWRWLTAPAVARACAVCLIAIVGYAAWDYTRISQIYLARGDRLAPWRDDTLAKLRSSWLFESQVQFAELTLTPVSQANAAKVHALAQRVIHFSPEPRVIGKLIESAKLLGRDEEALAHAQRFKIAFPLDYARWLDNEPMDDPAE